MAVTYTTRSGLPLVAAKHEDWDVDWRQQNNRLETLLAGQCNGNPQGQVEGLYAGQHVWSVDQQAMYACSVPGIAATAQWTPVSSQGVIPIERGGTGQTTRANARAALEVHAFYGANTYGYRPGNPNPQPDTKIVVARSDGYGQAADSWDHMPIQVQNHDGGHAGYALHNPGVNATALVLRRDNSAKEWWGTDGVQGAAIYRGMIFPFWGQIGQIPPGYALCDGNNGTPDLRNRVVVGTGNGGGYAIGQAFGSDASTTSVTGSHNHSGGTGAAGAHIHDGITQGTALNVGHLPPHTHGYTPISSTVTLGAFVSDEGGVKVGIGATAQTTSIGSGAAHAHGFNTNPTPDHTHAIFPQGDHAHTVDVRQPSVALLYIMKL